MKTRYFKKIFASALMVTAILGTSSCINPALTKMMYS